MNISFYNNVKQSIRLIAVIGGALIILGVYVSENKNKEEIIKYCLTLENTYKSYIDYIYGNNMILYPHKWMNLIKY